MNKDIRFYCILSKKKKKKKSVSVSLLHLFLAVSRQGRGHSQSAASTWTRPCASSSLTADPRLPPPPTEPSLVPLLSTQMQRMVNSDSRFTSSQQPMEAALGPRSQQQGPLSTINQSQLGVSGNSVTHSSPSPPGSKSATPSPSSSAHEDDNEDGLRVKTQRTHTHSSLM